MIHVWNAFDHFNVIFAICTSWNVNVKNIIIIMWFSVIIDVLI